MSNAKTIWVDKEATREVDLGFDPIPVCRPNFIKITFNGLRPSTRHWFFCAGIDATGYVSTDATQISNFSLPDRNSVYKNPGETYVNDTGYPTALGGGASSLYSDANGKIEGIFYLQRKADFFFSTGNITLNVCDRSDNNFEGSISYASSVYQAGGQISYSYTDHYIDGQVEIANPNYVPPPTAGTVISRGNDDNDRSGNKMITVLGHDGYNYYMTENTAKAHGWINDTGENINSGKVIGTKEGKDGNKGQEIVVNDGGVSSDNAENSGPCVVATYANEIGSTILNAREKRKAEVWCIRKFHGKWWGEALRRGYRHLGRQAINNGTADRHFQEFIDYVNFGSGKHRNFQSGLNFVYRTLQFITLGLTIAKREK